MNDKPLEILLAAIQKGIMINTIKKVPGAVINKLSNKSREVLSTLKSSDIENVRLKDWEMGTDKYYRDKEISEIKLKFDKQWNFWTKYLNLK